MMSTKLTKQEVEKVVQLANLKLTEAEIEKFTSQLSEVINYNVTELAQVNTEKIAPITNITGLKNVLRTDEAAPGLTQDEALANAKQTHNGFFKVKGILG